MAAKSTLFPLSPSLPTRVLISEALPVIVVTAVAVTRLVVPSLIAFKSAAVAVPAATVTVKLAARFTLFPASPSLPIRVLIAAAVPVMLVTAVAVTRLDVAALIVFK